MQIPQQFNSNTVKVIAPEEVARRCDALLRSIEQHKHAWPFLNPVDPVALNIPLYFQIIKHPMDIGTVRQNFDRKFYRTLQQFVADIRLVWSNCMTFNDASSQVHVMAKELSRHFESKLSKQFANTRTTSPLGQGMIITDQELELKGKVVEDVKLGPETATNDWICGICELEGNLLCCDGPCLGSFHLVCLKLQSFPESAKWYCPSCALGVYECFSCKEEGKADVEVFQCSDVTCGRFYHKECVYALEGTVRKSKGSPLTKFICPLHCCSVCSKPDHSKLIAKCFRCPKAYHYTCLPVENESSELYQVNNIYVICPDHPEKVKKNVPSTELLNAVSIQATPEDDKAASIDLFKQANALLKIGAIPSASAIWTGSASVRDILGSPPLPSSLGVLCKRELARVLSHFEN